MNEDCVLWEGYKDPQGYGRSYSPELGRSEGAHRKSYKENNGPIPEGMLVRHTCDTPGCVEPSHLIVGTHKDNTQDRIDRGRGKKTHCAHGHEYTPENTYVHPGRTARSCRTCRENTQRRLP